MPSRDPDDARQEVHPEPETFECYDCGQPVVGPTYWEGREYCREDGTRHAFEYLANPFRDRTKVQLTKEALHLIGAFYRDELVELANDERRLEARARLNPHVNGGGHV